MVVNKIETVFTNVPVITCIFSIQVVKKYPNLEPILDSRTCVIVAL